MTDNQRKKISLNFGRMSGEKARQMSSDTIGDIGPSKIDELLASITPPTAEEINNFGAKEQAALQKAIADLETQSEVVRVTTQQNRKTMEELKKQHERLAQAVMDAKGELKPPSRWQQAKNAAKSIFA
jgi:hypothetical protein